MTIPGVLLDEIIYMEMQSENSAKGMEFVLGTVVPLHVMYAMKIHSKTDLQADLSFQIF